MGLISLIVGGALDANKAIKQNRAKNDDTVQTVTVKNLYSIDVPSYLSPTTKLSEDASLQYINRTLDIAFQVIDESKAELINEIKELKEAFPNVDFGDDDELLILIATFALNSMFEDISKVEIYDYTETTINGMNAITLNAFQPRTFWKDAMYVSFGFIEGKKTLYQIAILSGGTSIGKLGEKLEKAIKSFREL